MEFKDFKFANEASLAFLKKDYLLPNQTLGERVQIIVETFARRIQNNELAERFLENFKKGWYSLSTPIWTNYGTNRGLPISCFGSYIGDSMESILYGFSEVGMMSKLGGGTSGYFDLRPRGAVIKDNGFSNGPFPFVQMFDLQSTVISQGSTRRGSFAAYFDIDHPDIMEILGIRDDGNPIQDMSYGVCVPDYWMQEMIAGDEYKRQVWAKVLSARYNFGYPYIFFTDNVNNNKPQVYKDKNMKIHASNLCTEIALPSSEEESFICCLASMNAIYFDEWKDTDAVELLVYFLDTVIEEFIEKARTKEFMKRAVRFAERHRAIGVGVLGWHSLLKSKMIPFESFEAKMLNNILFKSIQDHAVKASKELAMMFGEPELLKGYGLRNTCLTAPAPTKSSAFILEQASEGVEADKSNYYIKDLAKIIFPIKDRYLEKILIEKGKNTEEVWESIKFYAGSVQHLNFLTPHEKDVFKTWEEISPKEVIIQAAGRQRYIDQSQSINLFIHPKTPAKDLNKLMIFAWEQGVKTLYYQHSKNAAQEFARSILECKSCEA